MGRAFLVSKERGVSGILSDREGRDEEVVVRDGHLDLLFELRVLQQDLRGVGGQVHVRPGTVDAVDRVLDFADTVLAVYAFDGDVGDVRVIRFVGVLRLDLRAGAVVPSRAAAAFLQLSTDDFCRTVATSFKERV